MDREQLWSPPAPTPSAALPQRCAIQACTLRDGFCHSSQMQIPVESQNVLSWQDPQDHGAQLLSLPSTPHGSPACLRTVSRLVSSAGSLGRDASLGSLSRVQQAHNRHVAHPPSGDCLPLATEPNATNRGFGQQPCADHTRPLPPRPVSRPAPPRARERPAARDPHEAQDSPRLHRSRPPLGLRLTAAPGPAAPLWRRGRAGPGGVAGAAAPLPPRAAVHGVRRRASAGGCARGGAGRGARSRRRRRSPRHEAGRSRPRSRARSAVTWARRSPGACPRPGGGGPSGQDVVPAGGGGGITGRRQLPLRPQPQGAAPPSGAGVDPAAARGHLRSSRESPPPRPAAARRGYVTRPPAAGGARPAGRDGGQASGNPPGLGPPPPRGAAPSPPAGQ
ncbi:collagen alpha-1(I) chain-like [Caloenas nicobarica]|uniref:collagen alpha-1(I) chain-like n=1 Tax=Caloenas nicobarica TaxID=187106 RepID=UPI0032B78FE7